MEKCRLCLRSKEKLQLSHVIPNAFWRQTKSSKTGGKNGHYIEVLRQGNTYAQKSHDEYLLCYECEQSFSVNFENYVITLLLRKPENVHVHLVHEEHNDVLVGVDINKLRLFQLSILWRASISSLHFYSKIKLNEIEEETLRSVLFNLDTSSLRYFSCCMSFIFINKTNKSARSAKTFIVSPVAEYLNSRTKFIFCFGGVEWIFHYPLYSQHLANEIYTVPSTSKIKLLRKNIYDIDGLSNTINMGRLNQIKGNGININE